MPETEELTFEFWVKGKNPFRRAGHLLTMTLVNDNGRYDDDYMVIDVDGKDIVCLPFASELGKKKLIFDDTSNSYDYW